MEAEVHGAGRGATPASPPDTSDPAGSLADRVAELATTLPPREGQVLATLLLQAMDPVARRRWQPSQHLDPEQEALLERLLRDDAQARPDAQD